MYIAVNYASFQVYYGPMETYTIMRHTNYSAEVMPAKDIRRDLAKELWGDADMADRIKAFIKRRRRTYANDKAASCGYKRPDNGLNAGQNLQPYFRAADPNMQPHSSFAVVRFNGDSRLLSMVGDLRKGATDPGGLVQMTHTCKYASLYGRSLVRLHACTNSHSQGCTPVQTHSQGYTPERVHARLQARTQPRKPARTHATARA